jgi:hypothetical protein
MCTWKIGGFSGHSHTPQSNTAESTAVTFSIDDFDAAAIVPCYSCSLVKGKERGQIEECSIASSQKRMV